MINMLRRVEDEEHMAVSLSPANNDIIKDVRLVYYAPNLYMPSHTHAVGQFSTLLSGQALEQNIHAEVSNTQGLAEFKPIAYKHSNQIGPDGALFLSINLNSEEEQFVSEFGSLHWSLVEVNRVKALWKHLSSLLFQPAKALYADLDGIVLSLISASLSDDKLIKKAPNWLLLAEQALNETNMGVEEIAANVGVHRVHLSRVFQSHFGLSISDFKQRLALQKGIKSMLSNHESISSASASAGFSDQSHFTRVLKKQFGTTPKALNALLASPSLNRV